MRTSIIVLLTAIAQSALSKDVHDHDHDHDHDEDGGDTDYVDAEYDTTRDAKWLNPINTSEWYL